MPGLTVYRRFLPRLPAVVLGHADAATVSLLVFASLVYSFVAGKDLNWDQLNYHFYLGFSFARDRLGQDFMAANIQSYLNPLPYAPFYWMVASNWHSLLIAGVLATVHALNIVFAYLIGKTALGDVQGGRLYAFFGAVLAFLAPVFLSELGTTFADVTTAVPVVCALWLLMRLDLARVNWRILCAAGFLLGAATGLKLTNVIFGIAGAISLALLSGNPLTRVKALGALTAAGCIGLAATHGYWSWRLWREFGNPVFPMLNGVFQSPDYPAISHHHIRFAAENFLDLLSFPFRIVQLRSWIYTEIIAPDLRFVALIGLALIAFALTLRKARRPKDHQVNSSVRILVLFFCAAYTLWVVTSANGRYGIAVTLLCGPMCALIAGRWLREQWARGAASVLPVLCLVQLGHLINGELSWDAGKWTRTWYDAKIPAELATDPHLYISVGGSSNSYVAPLLAPGSAFTNPIGQLSFNLDGPGGKRLRTLFEKFRGRVRLISLQPPEDIRRAHGDAWLKSADLILARLGFVVDSSDCNVITTSGLTVQSGEDFSVDDLDTRRLATCRLKEIAVPDSPERQAAIKVMRSVVNWCPKLFQPDYLVVERTSSGWFSAFPDTDNTLRMEHGSLLVLPAHSAGQLPLGSVNSWLLGNRPVDCSALRKNLRRDYSL